MRKGRILIRQKDRVFDGWRCSMCSWLGLVPVLAWTFEPIPQDIQDAFRSHYCSKHPEHNLKLSNATRCLTPENQIASMSECCSQS